MSIEKELSYQITNTYSVLNDFTEKTKTVWLVCHGIGYLSRYFLRHFYHLNTEENYIVAPQAQSKYYLKNEYKHVGASWLTKERTEAETENVLAYLDEVYKAENLKNARRLIILGYSQGVSVATRWVASRKLKCDELIMHSGKVPSELTMEDFQFLKNTNFSFIYGTEDEYLKNGIIKVEEKRLRELFPNNLEIKTYKGGHEVNTELIAEFA
ncbi:Phospholipase/Carboxylesterase [Salegentibacter holothuriorum]|uniref:Phospholipase/Carboxylesterase n=1 Tax=Salegentibacter holothuriorum TaxID=241145 RepID=A0A1T5ATF1_9FLAO|nr:esterase [Salegentibacter holothuriorum]SKB37863.1 Phospholipase/Carboxylesterase [Salegentibacter holothuriorum]